MDNCRDKLEALELAHRIELGRVKLFSGGIQTDAQSHQTVINALRAYAKPPRNRRSDRDVGVKP